MYNNFMITVDQILLDVVNTASPTIEEYLLKRDAKVLRSLASIITTTSFITENQSRLLLKIIRDNQEKIPMLSDEMKESLSSPIWSRTFRQVEIIRKFFISAIDGDPCLTIEFTFSSPIRKALQEVSKKVSNLSQASNGKIYHADLTEKNIVALVEALEPFNFIIDEKIQNHYKIIKSWDRDEVQKQFLITNIVYPNFEKHITADLGIDTAIDESVIIDRSMRYQYFTENAKNFGENLTEIIANRDKTRVWVDKKQHSLTEVIASLIELKRLPVLVVFDTMVSVKYIQNLIILSEAMEKNGVNDNVGIYFRLSNDDTYKKFNQIVSDKNYNKRLDDQLEVAGVMSGKIPKFFLNTAWRPMSVIALDTRMGLRHGKTSVYANCCDCIVEWSEEDPMFDRKILLK
jgi:predicted oxidoreductase (fatty acid repression mutant protein)